MENVKDKVTMNKCKLNALVSEEERRKKKGGKERIKIKTADE